MQWYNPQQHCENLTNGTESTELKEYINATISLGIEQKLNQYAKINAVYT